MTLPAPAEALAIGKPSWSVHLRGLGVPVVRVEVELAIAVGQEIDRLADPHRLGVVAAPGGLGDLFVRKVIEIEHPDPGGSPAAIILPLPEGLAQRRVSKELPIR